MDLLLIAIGLQITGGILAFLFGRWPRAATTAGSLTALVAAALGLLPTVAVLLGGLSPSYSAQWESLRGPFHLELDALSAVFLFPVLVLSALAAVYGANYLFAYRQERSLGLPWLFFNLFVAGMWLVVLARTAFLFLFAWEIMSLAAYFLVTFEHDRSEVRRAGWVYLVATHLGVAFLMATFMLLARQADSLSFAAFASRPPEGATASLVFLLALVGFGAKAGLVPWHVWLPEAHPAAPSHVSALMSGVMIKMGIYGLLRVLSFLGEPAPWWGPTLGCIGLLTALIGIALAVYQRDLKRVLAYSSIENVGLITLGLGVALWGRAIGETTLAILGLTAALLHMWNHALMKGLLFLCAGNVVHGTGTRDMERLGGLLKRMPWTGTFMLLGAVAIAALPPLNGFTSKWLLYIGLLSSGLESPYDRGLTALFTVAALALVGGLAAIAYVRLCGIVLLGSPRSEVAEDAHESSAWMLGPMVILLVLCLGAAVVPGLVVGLFAPAIGDILGRTTDLTVPEGHLTTLGDINAWTLAGLLLGGGVVWRWLRGTDAQVGQTWGCGYAQPTPRMQYTARSFSEILAEHLLPRFLRPRLRRLVPHSLFPSSGQFHTATPDPVNERIYEPFFRRWADRFAALRVLQQGLTHIYLGYILVALILGLAWVSLRSWSWGAG